MRIFFVSCFFFWGLFCIAADLVLNGKPNADIVISENADPATRMAAEDLQKHLRLISGAELPVVFPSDSKAEVKVCVGESDCSGKAGYKMSVFHSSGYDIWVNRNYVVLNGPSTFHPRKTHSFENSMHEQSRLQILTSAGILDKQHHVSSSDDCGPMHAVSAFLESLGVRFYAPCADGTVIPHKKTITIPDCRITREAAFAGREYQNSAFAEFDTEGMLWLKRLKTGSAMPRIGTLPLALVMREEGAKHPEWFARDKHGRKLQSLDQCGVPRFLSKSLQQACVRYLRKMCDADRNLKYITIAEPVSPVLTDHQDFESSRVYDQYPDPVRNNIRFVFILEIAKELEKTHPDRKLVWFNIRNDAMPDKRFFPHKQKNLILCPGSLSVHHYASPGKCSSMKKLYAAASGEEKAGQHEFWNTVTELETTPVGFWSFQSLQQMRQFQRKYLSAFLMDLPTDQKNRPADPVLTHLAVYINSKLLWDPHLDLNALLDEYNILWYGPAAKKMRDFQKYADSVAARNGSRAISLKYGKMKPSDISAWFYLLEQAKTCTTADSVYRRRIEALEKTFDWMKTAFQNKTPRGGLIKVPVFPGDTECNGNLAKYKHWLPFPSGNNTPKTEISIAMDEARMQLQIGFRCYEKNMKKMPAKPLPPDSRNIFLRDHLEISFYSPDKGIYTVAVDCAGSLFEGSSCPDDLDANGSFAAWNRPLTRCRVTRHADCWEGEVFIDSEWCGKAPDWNPAWGLNAARIRYVGGRKETLTLVPGTSAFPASRVSSWRQLTLPKTDAKGRPCNLFYHVLIPIPGIRHEPVYLIHKAKAPVKLSDPWNSASWKDIPEIRLGYELFKPGQSSGFRPDARAKIQYDDQYIYVLYKVDDRYVCANCRKDQSMVCLDSAMEIFIRPKGNGSYYNFEANCIGKLLLYQCTPGRNPLPLSPEELKSIKRFSTLPENFKGEATEPVTWRMGLQIPIKLFIHRSQVTLPLKNQVWTGNVMKCAERNSHPCWLTWQPSALFHCPDEFGKFIFE